MAAKPKVDYDRIEEAFRAGVISVPQLAADYTKETGVKVSHTAINKHFKKLGITRDLSAKVQAKAKAMVSEAMVSGKVSVGTNLTDSVIINENATIVANVELSQRKDIARYRSLAMSLLGELEHQTHNPELYERMAELLISSEESALDKLSELYRRTTSTSGRIDSMKKLAETLKTLIALEREAFNIDSRTPEDDPLTAFVKRVQGGQFRPVALDDGES